jgi:hypothetical protein
MDLNVIFVLGLVFGLAVLAYRVVEYRTWDKGKSLEDFKAAHPKSFPQGRFMACPYCGGTVLRVLKYHKGTLRKKFCKICNKELWREKG